MENNRLDSKEERILSYIYSKENYIKYSGVEVKEIAIYLGVSVSKSTKLLMGLREKKYLISKIIGKYKKYIITSEAKNYLKVYDISPVPINDIKSYSYEESQKVIDTINEINVLKEEIEKIKKQYEDQIINMEKNINKKINSFYGRIGEILALIITAVAMIVFNIQLIGSVEIDFSEPLKAVQTILAIDIPYIILFVVLILVFHVIIGKDESGKVDLNEVKNVLVRSIPILLLIIVCFIFIA